MTIDETEHQEAKSQFMEIYFEYIDKVGGGKEWAMIHRDYADMKIQEIMLLFAKELVIKGTYNSSKVKEAMISYDFELPEGNELAMIDSYLATLYLTLDSVTKKINDSNKQQDKGSTLVGILAHINSVNKVYLPYNSILLIEFIEAYKLVKEQEKQLRNGRLNNRNSK